MAKDPAFLFYSNDFLTGVADLTFEERGQYITLLALQHQKGHLTEKIIKITVPNVSQDVISKFKIDEQGMYYNERLELEAKKRAEHSKKQKERAIKGWKKRKEESQNITETDATADATALPLENESENKDEIDFNVFWDLYDKKTDKVKCESKWKRIKPKEQRLIIEHVPKYVKSTPEKKYRKNPLTYLNGKVWLDDELPLTVTIEDKNKDDVDWGDVLASMKTRRNGYE